MHIADIDVEPGRIAYRDGYKYQLAERIVIQTPLRPDTPIITKFYSLTLSGRLTIEVGYCWDGASGGLPDTDNNQRGSCVHDVTYQMLRMKQLDPMWKPICDMFFAAICRVDGPQFGWLSKAYEILTGLYYFALLKYGAESADPANRRQIKYGGREDDGTS